MQEGNIQSRLDVCGRRTRCRIILCSCLARRAQKQPPVRIERRQFGREYRHPARRVLVWYENCPTAVFASEPAVPAHKTLARFSLGLPPLVGLVASIPAGHNSQRQRKGRDKTRGTRAERSLPRQCVQASDQTRVKMVEGLGKPIRGRLAKGGLSGHIGELAGRSQRRLRWKSAVCHLSGAECCLGVCCWQR
jgi:hypothetical protein